MKSTPSRNTTKAPLPRRRSLTRAFARFQYPALLLLPIFIALATILVSCVQHPDNPADPTNPDFTIIQWLRCNFFHEPVCPQAAGGASGGSGSGGSAGVAAQAPNQVASAASLKLWLKADAGITQATGVSSWADQSGNGNDATQGTGASQPAFVASEPGLNGQAVLRFDGVNSYMTTPDFFNISDPSVLVVSKSIGTGQQRIFSVRNSAIAEFLVYTQGNFRSHITDGNGSNEIGIISTHSSTNYYIGSVIKSLKSSTLWFNGLNSGTNSNSLFNTTVDWSLGSNAPTIGRISGTNPNLYYLNGDIAEIIVFSVALPDSEREAIECYLSQKYGIAVAQTCQ